MARIFFLLCFIVVCKGNNSNNLTLNQVLVLSRHNIRTPLTTNLADYSSSKIWPKFNETDGLLTQKGALMETYMGEYFSEWFASEDFIKGCPKKEDILIYSNTKSRTIETAKSFTDSCFRNCNISISHSKNLNDYDPIFKLNFHNDSEYYIHQTMKELESKLNKINLTESYLELNRILDLKNSVICKQKGLCDFTVNKSVLFYKNGVPNVDGPLRVSARIVDNFVMSFYEGFPLETIAWGKVTTDAQWKLLCKLLENYINIRFGSVAVEDIGKPLLQYMFNIFNSGNRKFTNLVGHDSNICIILKALGFKQLTLLNQYESYPIGGKLVFQKWSDGAKSFLKVEYVYPTSLQLRNSEKLSLAHPPQKVLLELNNCKIDERGFCPWEDFEKLNI